jgi:hypothetical protein
MTGMTSSDFRIYRTAAGLGVVEYGQALGYQGNANTISRLIRSFEYGEKPIPEYIQRLCSMFWRHGIPREFLPEPSRDHNVGQPGIAK